MRPRVGVPDITRRLYRTYTRGRAFLPRLAIELQQRRRYGDGGCAEVSPWRIIWIDPQLIVQTPKSKKRIYPKNDRLVAHIHNGDWDLDPNRFDGSPIVRAIQARILHKTPWHQTDLVRELRQRLSSPGAAPTWHGCRTMADVEARCAAVDRLITAISTSGYRTPPGIADGFSGLTNERSPKAVSVGVDRTGRLLHLNGRHRMAIAQALGLSEIPVRIGVRHADWQRLRQDHVKGNALQLAPPDIRTHPDMAFLSANTAGA